ncbi:UDP-glucose 4-epimerase GalE [Stenotrophobium rhamnosiphilum]|uniref:UDP-glucose 4-epimerase n=2 Tax=Stenotrophobium rhamnosiphilum TaxID=2029166 RepID=A0A2T5ML44_9GAMM|nr:UDP-glucose 4-epimerase GalE [Stenotrophobium rhamnosiphilum]
MKRVLVTGGAGYIGSHTLVELSERGYELFVLDDFSNSTPRSLDAVAKITGKKIPYKVCDIRSEADVAAVFRDFRPDAVIHFAGVKSVGESCREPVKYYEINVQGTLNLLSVMQAAGCRNLIFSSSATVYGAPSEIPLTENAALRPVNPYGHSKRMCEQVLLDLAAADTRWRVGLLRYFNPAGAHASGLIGEDPNGEPHNLVPYISQVASGLRTELKILGDDYETPDGTGVRDYIHVVDLAIGHVVALQHILEGTEAAPLVVNLGSGAGCSVMDVLTTFRRVSGQPIPARVVERRPGDLPSYYSSSALAAEKLNWRTERGIEEICRDAWNWQSKNPQGYGGGQ